MRNAHNETASGIRARAPGYLVLIVTVPFLLHLVGVGWYVMTADQIRMTLADVIADTLAVVYLGVGLLLLRFNPGLARKYAVGAWSLILSMSLVEMALPFALPEKADAVPWLPTKQVYTAADTMPGVSGEIVLTINPELGLRAPLDGFESADLRLLCLGGSSTECLYVTDEKTWPRLLQQKLSDSLGLRVFVGNGGRSGHFTLHTIEKIKNYSAIGSFDLILVMTGINDLVTLFLENYDEREKTVGEEALFRNPYWENREGPYYTRFRWLSELHYIKRVQELKTQAIEMPDGVVQDDAGEWYAAARKLRQTTLRNSPRDTLPADMDAALDRYRTNLEKIIELSEELGKTVVFVTQPTLYEEEMPRENSELIWGGVNQKLGFAYTDRILARLMQAYNDVLLETCAAHDVECIDLATTLPKDTSVFYDDCHFNISGCEKVASALAEHLSIRFQPDVPDLKTRGTGN